MAADERPLVHESYALGERAMQELRGPFAAWLDENVEVDEEVGPEAVVEAVTVGAGGLLTVRPGAQLTRLTPEDVEALVGQVIPAMVEDTATPEPDEMVDDLAAIWWQLLTFLGETGRWQGSASDLETNLVLLAGEPPELAEVLAAAAEDVDEGEEDAAVLASFPVRAAQAVLAHVGEGIEVPDDAELAGDDVTAILASFEHRIPSTVDADGEPTDLEDVPWLRQVVLLMLDLDLLDGEDETLLAPGPEAEGWLQPTPEPRELRRHLVGRFILDDPTTLEEGFSISDAVLPTILASAITGNPFDDAALNGLVDNAAVLGPAAGVAVEELRERLSDLGALGLLSESAPWTVARGFWPALAAAVDAEEEDDVLGDLFGDGEPHWLENVMGQLGVGDAQMQQIRNILGGR
ncbi:hypothetical protein [Kineococcus rhizosphaerae]|uniref:Uncharacterized protein n=1 Tax=Kineococcus rhizosphaerae TaxID=559628 RepID=A0A2T0QXV3_9ACTN|nr:hypothetical protein [Kineococcus rhizosphaerae]PRY10861.1 hypothetical protein CLV37_115125 [Kineococcus rhizosphaerae]